MTPASDYETKKARLQEQMRQVGGVRLAKKTSNLFRTRKKTQEHDLSVRDFNHILEVNIEEGWADVEGMTTYEDFVDETLKHGLMPAVVPQLKTITIGGAVAGVGIESTSFRYGLVHETVLEMEILLASGEVVTCNKNDHADLFSGFPNSYGTFGYALRLKVKLIPVKPFVKINHAHYKDPETYFKSLKEICEAGNEDNDRVDFVDGTMFGPAEMYITTGTFVEKIPAPASDYTYMDIYYRSIRERKEDYLSVYDYIWRWDTDWFWCSDAFGAQIPMVRRLLGKKRLNSAVYWKIQHFFQRHPLLLKFATRFARQETVIQDVDIPIDNAPAFAEFFFQEINIRPIWICPIGSYDKTIKFDLYPLDPKKLYVNFGFWSTVPSQKEPGYYNRMIEAKVSELHGKKGLYSESFYTPQEFWSIYDKDLYDDLKEKYDPLHKLKDLFEKTVKRQ
jgi:FAD/FMN-containing dehydrogenase